MYHLSKKNKTENM